MIVNYFNVQRIAVFPAKADSPLIVDPYTVLSLAVAFQSVTTGVTTGHYGVGPPQQPDKFTVNTIGNIFLQLRPHISGIF